MSHTAPEGTPISFEQLQNPGACSKCREKPAEPFFDLCEDCISEALEK